MERGSLLTHAYLSLTLWYTSREGGTTTLHQKKKKSNSSSSSPLRQWPYDQMSPGTWFFFFFFCAVYVALFDYTIDEVMAVVLYVTDRKSFIIHHFFHHRLFFSSSSSSFLSSRAHLSIISDASPRSAARRKILLFQRVGWMVLLLYLYYIKTDAHFFILYFQKTKRKTKTSSIYINTLCGFCDESNVMNAVFFFLFFLKEEKVSKIKYSQIITQRLENVLLFSEPCNNPQQRLRITDTTSKRLLCSFFFYCWRVPRY